MKKQHDLRDILISLREEKSKLLELIQALPRNSTSFNHAIRELEDLEDTITEVEEEIWK